MACILVGAETGELWRSIVLNQEIVWERDEALVKTAAFATLKGQLSCRSDKCVLKSARIANHRQTIKVVMCRIYEHFSLTDFLIQYPLLPVQSKLPWEAPIPIPPIRILKGGAFFETGVKLSAEHASLQKRVLSINLLLQLAMMGRKPFSPLDETPRCWTGFGCPAMWWQWPIIFHTVLLQTYLLIVS